MPRAWGGGVKKERKEVPSEGGRTRWLPRRAAHLEGANQRLRPRGEPALWRVGRQEALDVSWGAVDDAEPLIQGGLQAGGAVHGGIRDLHTCAAICQSRSHLRCCA